MSFERCNEEIPSRGISRPVPRGRAARPGSNAGKKTLAGGTVEIQVTTRRDRRSEAPTRTATAATQPASVARPLLAVLSPLMLLRAAARLRVSICILRLTAFI